MSSSKSHQWCVVPNCKNNNVTTPGKVFINVPLNPVKRKRWLKACGIESKYAATSKLHCCEDHFELRTDMENFLAWKMVGGNKKMKDDVTPHKFLDQPKPIDMGLSEIYYDYKPVLDQVYTISPTVKKTPITKVEPDQLENSRGDIKIEDDKNVLSTPADDEKNHSSDTGANSPSIAQQKAPVAPRKYSIVIEVYKLSNVPKSPENEGPYPVDMINVKTVY